jgi:hypothetical protein
MVLSSSTTRHMGGLRSALLVVSNRTDSSEALLSSSLVGRAAGLSVLSDIDLSDAHFFQLGTRSRMAAHAPTSNLGIARMERKAGSEKVIAPRQIRYGCNAPHVRPLGFRPTHGRRLVNHFFMTERTLNGATIYLTAPKTVVGKLFGTMVVDEGPKKTPSPHDRISVFVF